VEQGQRQVQRGIWAALSALWSSQRAGQGPEAGIVHLEDFPEPTAASDRERAFVTQFELLSSLLISSPSRGSLGDRITLPVFARGSRRAGREYVHLDRMLFTLKTQALGLLQGCKIAGESFSNLSSFLDRRTKKVLPTADLTFNGSVVPVFVVVSVALELASTIASQQHQSPAERRVVAALARVAQALESRCFRAVTFDDLHQEEQVIVVREEPMAKVLRLTPAFVGGDPHRGTPLAVAVGLAFSMATYRPLPPKSQR
jgi:hypothetical protein